MRKKVGLYALYMNCFGEKEAVGSECIYLLNSPCESKQGYSVQEMEEILNYWGRGKPMEFYPQDWQLRAYISTWTEVLKYYYFFLYLINKSLLLELFAKIS
jgi:hypothetical protein